MGRAPRDNPLQFIFVFGDAADLNQLGFDNFGVSHLASASHIDAQLNAVRVSAGSSTD
jgi:hypothetical protein